MGEKNKDVESEMLENLELLLNYDLFEDGEDIELLEDLSTEEDGVKK